MPLAAADRITGLILAGGRGGRMGGTDQGLVEIQGRPLVAHAVECLAPHVAGVMVSANRNFECYRSFVSSVVGGSVGDFSGPLAGIEAGLARATTRWTVVVPCDAPRLPRTFVADLANAANVRGAAAGRRAVRGWLAEVGAAAFDFDDSTMLRFRISPEALADGGP